MLLSELCEAVTLHLNTNIAKWTELGITVKTELDPMLCLLPELGVYIVPQFISYGEKPATRNNPQPINETLFFTLIVSKVFMELPTSDGVANWEEVKPLLDLRQRAERMVLNFSSQELTRVSVESEVFDEVELDNRNFVSMTTFGFERTGCVTEHELS